MTHRESSTSTEAGSFQIGLIRFLAVLSLSLVAIDALSICVVDPDLWGHVQYGLDMLSSGSMPSTATHSFTATNQPWINHEHFSELGFAFTYQHVGARGLLIFKALLGAALILVMAWSASRQGIDPLAFMVVAVLVSWNLRIFFVIRPQLISFVCFPTMIACLDVVFVSWGKANYPELVRSSRLLAWMVPLFLVWVNSHGGFVAGLCVLMAYLGCRVVEGLIRFGLVAWPLYIWFATVLASSLLVTVVNPYGLTLHRWLANSLAVPRPEIVEWNPPYPPSGAFVPLAALLFIGVSSIALTNLRRDWTQIIVLALVAGQSLVHQRHIAFLALLFGMWIPPHFHSALTRFRSALSSLYPHLFGSMYIRGLLCALCVISIGSSVKSISVSMMGLPVYADEYPIDAIQFMADNKLHGKVHVAFNWAQYLIAALSPNCTVAFDGRYDTCYPQHVIDMHFDFLLLDNDGRRQRGEGSGPIDGTVALEYGQPELALVDRRFPASAEIMERESRMAEPTWVLLFQDDLSQLWGRRSIYDNRAHSKYFEPSLRKLMSVNARLWTYWPALPNGLPLRGKQIGL